MKELWEHMLVPSIDYITCQGPRQTVYTIGWCLHMFQVNMPNISSQIKPYWIENKNSAVYLMQVQYNSLSFHIEG